MKLVLVFTLAVLGGSSMSLADDICSLTDPGVKSHEDCSRFYMCDRGVAYEMVCPNPLYFNGGACDYPENVPECVGGTRAPPTETDPWEPEESEEPISWEEPAPEEPTSGEAPAPEESEEVAPEEPTSGEAPDEEPALEDGQCPNAPYYYLANPSNPNAFFICRNGEQSGSANCGQGLAFNQQVQGCLIP